MSLVWLIVLLVYGLATGWDIHPLFWWLLVPLFGQDGWDVNHKRR